MNEEPKKLERDRIYEERLMTAEREQWFRLIDIERARDAERASRTEPFKVEYLEVFS